MLILAVLEREQGHGQGPQISKDELTFRMSLFVAAMKAERTGGGQTDIKVGLD